MGERVSEQHYSNETKQPRMEWYLVHDTATNLVKSAEQGNIKPQHLVFIGGFAAYFHLREALGRQTMFKWRGTHDLDIVIFEKNGAAKLVGAARQIGAFEEVTYEESLSLPDKYSSAVMTLKGRGYLSPEKRHVEVDLYTLNPRTGTVQINNRHLRPHPAQFITEQVQMLPIREEDKRKGLPELRVTVPSLVDTIILKLDIIQYSPGFRDKDASDILGLLRVAELKGVEARDVLNKTLSRVEPMEFWVKTRDELTRLIGSAQRKASLVRQEAALVPSLRYLTALNEALKNYQFPSSGSQS